MMAWVYGLLAFELAIVSWIDIKTKKISNFWFFINLIQFVCFYSFVQQSYLWNWNLLIFPIGWIILGFLLFLLNIMGAGDSKFLASFFLLIPYQFHQNFFIKIVYTTLIVGLIMIIFKIIKDFRTIKAYALSAYWKGLVESIKSNFSYAPVILLAWLWLGIDLWQ